MPLWLSKTFGGLSPQYYFRQLVFGGLITAFFLYMQMQSKAGFEPKFILILVVNTALYPYARFVYESVIDFVLGKNVFIVNAFMLLITKAFTMLICWSLGMLIAPVGLLYLYFRNRGSTTDI